MRSSDVTTLVLPPEARSVSLARRHLREVLADGPAERLLAAAELAVSELVTNAVVHAGTEVRLRVRTGAGTLRVDVGDRSPHLPVRRSFGATAGTGRGLHLVDESVDRWDVTVDPEGKTVWFEIGDPGGGQTDRSGRPGGSPTVEVVLRQVPLLMHAAWQEHAASLLREQLLANLDEDLDALERHAEASDALNVLAEQVPVPDLPDDPDALMSGAVEPFVSAEELVLRVPLATVPRFAALQALLDEAVTAARAGLLLAPPTQPEIEELRRWLCTEVLEQARDGRPPTAWAARSEMRAPLSADEAVAALRDELAASEAAVVATDEASVIVAVTAAALRMLGYDDESQLVGRRVITVVPRRFHQAHVAGTTLHVLNGRDPLIGVPVTVPALRADGTELPVLMTVEVRRLGAGRRAFTARFELPA